MTCVLSIAQSAVTKLQEALKSKPQCLNQLVEFLGHRSARVSSFFLFILLRLLHIAAKFPAIKEHFVTLDIVDKTRQLARSRFSHVQVRLTCGPCGSDKRELLLTPFSGCALRCWIAFVWWRRRLQYGARLIFALLQTAPWAALFGEKYSGDKALFLRDLTNSPLLSSLFLDACLQVQARLVFARGDLRQCIVSPSVACWLVDCHRVVGFSAQSLLRLASNDGSDPNELACSFLWKDGHYFETLLQQVLGSDCSQQIPRVLSLPPPFLTDAFSVVDRTAPL